MVMPLVFVAYGAYIRPQPEGREGFFGSLWPRVPCLRKPFGFVHLPGC